MTTTTIALIILAILIAAMFVWMIINMSSNGNSAVLEERSQQLEFRNTTLEQELQQERQLLAVVNKEKEDLVAQLATSRADFKNLNEKLLNQQEELEQKFENLANKILDEKSKKFTAQNKEGIEQILKPLNEKIKDFQEKVEKTNKESIAQHASLREQLLGLKELNNTMTTEAQNLTKALKGDRQIQGAWGELVLDKVLEKSGLEQGREYEKQVSETTEEGDRQRLDVVINLPDGKKMIIDSKVSLSAYEKFINALTDEDEQTNLKAHVAAIKFHIKDLSERNYHELYATSPDFVLMFVPVETAFSSAINFEPKLYNDAFAQNIVIVTPSTLLATLKTIDTLWQNEKQKKNTLEIARQAGALYDKFDGLLKDLELVGKQLRTVQGSYENSMKKLTTGSGNLIKKVEDLKTLGIKANKQIDRKWLERADEENDEENEG